jgi:pimeloyl-ACP methyl ester carboxylesterase
MLKTPTDPPAPALPAAVSGARHEIDTPAGRVSYYVATPDAPELAATAAPLLLVHSVNAAASAYEVKPLYEHYRRARLVYAIDLPGFGFSERSARRYTPRLMTDAVLALADEIATRHGGQRPDGLAVSASCEFMARAEAERPGTLRSLALVSATGLDRARPLDAAPGSDRGQAWLLAALGRAPWSSAFYRLLGRPGVVRWFLEKTWGGKHIDEGLLAYDVLTMRQPGAQHAPFFFVSGYLFSADITRVYEQVAAPVWLVHGVRGDFVDYRDANRLAKKAGWAIEVMPTGALPYFEDLASFTAAYDAFLARLAPA